ncbi:MAG: TonB-dependent receptor [Prevotella sp.]|nr:TonB-dependent receptor [Prevotella sp.]
MQARVEWRPTVGNETGEELADTSRVQDLDEVVVVSQPKESLPLRQQPLSASMFGLADIEQLQIHDLRDLSAYVPSFTMPNYGSRYTSSMYIRGIGSRVNSPAVGVYIDNIPVVSKSMFNSHLYGVERVDVLRGPQGTLYGQNTEGGLVRMYTRDPLKYQGTDIRLGVGTGLTRQAEVAHHAKLSPTFGLSLSAFYNGQNGFFENQATGDRADEFNEGGGRVRMAWQPNSRLTFGLTGDYQYTKQNGFPYGLMDIDAGTTSDPSTNRQGTYNRHMLTTGFSMEYKGDWAVANYAASWQYLKDQMLMDIDYLPQDYMHMEQAQLQNALTQELTLKSLTDGPWQWVFGGFFSHQALKTNAPVYFDPEMNAFLSKTITDYAYYGMLNSMAARMGMDAAAAMIARMGGCTIDMQVATIPGLFRTPQQNFGLFHESNIDLGKRLTATLGLRYDLSQVSIDYETSALATLSEDVMGVHVDAAVHSALAHHEWDHFNQLLPKFGLTYKLNGGSNLYATVAKGYRAGGFNIQMFSDILQTELQSSAQSARGEYVIEHDETAYSNIRETIAYKPETSWNYEFGTHLNLFGDAVQFDFAGFYVQVQNQQLSVMSGNYGFGRMMVNAGKSYSCGVEASLRGQAVGGHLTWAASYGYTRAVFKDYIDSVAVGGENQPVDYKDKRVPFVPEHTFAANADYRFDFGQTGLRSITVGANVSGLGKTWWDEANTYSQGLYATLGAHADADFGLVKVSLWGRNLTDAKYNTFAVSSAATGEKKYFGQLGNPLQVGVDVRLHF